MKRKGKKSLWYHVLNDVVSSFLPPCPNLPLLFQQVFLLVGALLVLLLLQLLRAQFQPGHLAFQSLDAFGPEPRHLADVRRRVVADPAVSGGGSGFAGGGAKKKAAAAG